MGLCGPEDVVDGSCSQHLPHGLVDDLLIVPTAHRHWAQETHGEYLLQEGVCGKTRNHHPPMQGCQHYKHNNKDSKQKK